MTLSTVDLAKARDLAKTILEELRLDAYIYEIEPRDDYWELTVECACEIDGGWKRVTLQVPKKELLGGFEDETKKRRLLEYWKKKLVECKLLKE